MDGFVGDAESITMTIDGEAVEVMLSTQASKNAEDRIASSPSVFLVVRSSLSDSSHHQPVPMQ